MTKEQFEKVYQQTQQECKHHHQQSNQLAIIRFICMFIAILSLLIAYFQTITWLYIMSLMSLILFVILVVIHNRIKNEYQQLKATEKVYQKHLDRIAGRWREFLHTGDEYLDEKDYKSLDLDVFSKNSLFQMINIAFSQKGQKRLAELLIKDSQRDEILQRQAAVKELAENEDFVFQLETLGYLIPTKKTKTIDQWIALVHQQKVSTITPAIFIVSFLTILGLLGLCFQIGTPYSQVLFEIGVVFQLGFVILNLKKHQELFAPIEDLSQGLESYAQCYAHIHNCEYHCEYLRYLKNKMCIEGKAVEGILELSKLAQRVIYRHNIFAFLFLNGLGLFDFYLRNQYAKWLNEYGQLVACWFDGLAEIEALMSLSVLKIDDFKVTLPQITEEKTLSFQELCHPLIDQKQVVGNDFSMEKPLCIITGSNMSGKTTFMRTIGLNLILAYAGGYVFGESLQCSCLHIMTSMRVKDNVEEGVSTFYGELLRIKDMIQYAKKKEPMLCLIDEIFKGTNSLDRIAGAKATIEKLSLPYSYTFLTTHDLELSRIQQMNYHFDEYYQDGQIYFDYQIKKGPSKSTNGQFLLKQLGILE